MEEDMLSMLPGGTPPLDVKKINRRGSIASRLTAASLGTHRSDLDTSRTSAMVTERNIVDIESAMVMDEHKMGMIGEAVGVLSNATTERRMKRRADDTLVRAVTGRVVRRKLN
eukprot:GHVS01076344.1.p1 GENE.GHVS01076344.1~~GHVS01076344.1.p1  ORF type:complete len:113 (-),score=22.81 GHVS01076344.1:261-599(-)